MFIDKPSRMTKLIANIFKNCIF